jgi:hypothetical protein
MKLINVTSRRKNLLIAGILLLGCVVAGDYELICNRVAKKEMTFKNGQLEKVVIYDTISCRIEAKDRYRIEVDEDMWYLDSNAYWQMD